MLQANYKKINFTINYYYLRQNYGIRTLKWCLLKVFFCLAGNKLITDDIFVCMVRGKIIPLI